MYNVIARFRRLAFDEDDFSIKLQHIVGKKSDLLKNIIKRELAGQCCLSMYYSLENEPTAIISYDGGKLYQRLLEMYYY